MSTVPASKKILPMISTLLLMLGILLIFCGFVVEFVGRPERGGQSFWTYLLTMRSAAVCVLLGICLAMADNFLKGGKTLVTQEYLPRTTSLIFFIGGALILASVFMQRNAFSETAMAIGAMCELSGAFLTWRWLQRRKSPTN